jgi:predicted ATPase/DNA-binding CsgD family transcriptional regulator
VANETHATLLERDHEISQLHRALSDANQSRGRFVLLESAAGMGKTSLLSAAFDLAGEAGFLRLRARAGELERDFAYGCVRQMLDAVVAKASSAERERLFEGAAGLAQPLFARRDSSQPVAFRNNAFAMLHGLYWLLNNVATERPVALFIDDLHWADAESLRFLTYLTPRLDGVPLAVVSSTRPTANYSPDLIRLAAAPEIEVLKLQPLSVGAVARICARRLGATVDESFALACRDATGGNPFLLDALLLEARDRRLSTTARDATRVHRLGPAAVAQAVILRLADAPAAAAALVRAAAVLGDGARLTEAARLAEISDDEAVDSADRLIALAVLKPAETVEFAHPIVREALYADIGPNERARAHARAAEILAEAGASEERVAAQIAASEPTGDSKRVELLRRVAAAALARGAPAAAAAMLRRALREPPPAASRAEVLLELGSAEVRLALPASIDHLEAAAEGLTEPRSLATAVRHLANALAMRGDAERAVAALESVIADVEVADRELGLILTAELAAKAQQASREARAPAAQRLMRYCGLEGVTPGERLVLASIAFERARSSESAQRAVEYIEREIDPARLLNEQDIDVVGPFYELLIGLVYTDAVDLGARCVEQALAEAQARASVPAMAYLSAFRGWFALRAGALEQADTDARTSLELLTGNGIELGTRFALSLLVEALIERGDPLGAERALRDSGLEDDIPPALANNNLLHSRGLLHIAVGRFEAGIADLVEFGRRDELWGGASALASRWRSHACLALAALGESERAQRMATAELDRARRWGAAGGIGVALRAAALVDRGSASLHWLREAVAALERSPARLEHARALTDLGAALRRDNRRAEARGVLQHGLEIARQCDARPLVERALVELRAAGGRSNEAGPTDLQSLTVSERRVAELAAKGHSNPRIAQTLFITRKTVETHLSHVYAKLGISGRAELGRALVDAAHKPAATQQSVRP